MKMQRVDAPNIQAVGYDADLELMHVQFRGGLFCPSYTLEYKVTPAQWARMQPDGFLGKRPFPVRVAGSRKPWR